MTYPSREQFHTWAADHRALPVWREVVADLTTPLAAFARVVGSEAGFLLESVDRSEHWSRWSFTGRRPLATMVAHGTAVTIEGSIPAEVPLDRGILAAAEAVLEAFSSPEVENLPPLHGGLVGYLGYDVVREIERLPDAPEDDTGLPDAILDVIGELAAFDHWRQRVVLVANVLLPANCSKADIDAAYDDAMVRLDALAASGANPLDEPMFLPPEMDGPVSKPGSSMDGASYQQAVAAAKEYILAGDIFQVVLSQRFELETTAAPLDIYRVLRQINPSPYMYFYRRPEVTLVGASPEPMVQLLDGRVISRPIAGTRRRGTSDIEDRRLGAELREDAKEKAEHVMLVDLARNDIGRVISFGSMEIDELMSLELYSHVMHLTSQVSGDLADGRTPIDVLRATLPAGTVSGAPKVRAMEIIDEFEPTKRGPYAGVVGYIDFRGNMDTALAIRTMVMQGNKVSIQAGAGVVADSVPELENDECFHKASALLAAIPAAEEMAAIRRAAGTNHDPAGDTNV